VHKHPRLADRAGENTDASEFASCELSSLPDPADIPLSSKGDLPNVGMTETFGPHANRKYFNYRIVDPYTGKELPDGEEGEFCVRGFGLMTSMYKREREEVFDADGYYHTAIAAMSRTAMCGSRVVSPRW